MSAPVEAAPAMPGAVDPATTVRFAGYAAIFDRVDRGGDIVRPGAFVRSLAEQADIPLYWQHDGDRPAGTITTIAEDERGLRVIAAVDGEAARAIASRQLAGLSFGYRIRQARTTVLGRELIDLDLIEVSIVAQPMQPLARIHAIETAPGETDAASDPACDPAADPASDDSASGADGSPSSGTIQPVNSNI